MERTRECDCGNVRRRFPISLLSFVLSMFFTTRADCEYYSDVYGAMASGCDVNDRRGLFGRRNDRLSCYCNSLTRRNRSWSCDLLFARDSSLVVYYRVHSSFELRARDPRSKSSSVDPEKSTIASSLHDSHHHFHRRFHAASDALASSWHRS